MSKLYTDCKTDKERAEFFRSGKAWESGIVAKSLENDIADVFAFRARVEAALAELRAEFERKMTVVNDADSVWANGRNVGIRLAIHELDATTAALLGSGTEGK